MSIDKRDAVGRELAGFVNAVLMQHVRGDHRGVAAILDAQLEASPRLREMIEEANESSEIEQARMWAHKAGNSEKSELLPPYNCEGEDPWSKLSVPDLRRALDVANRTGVNLVAENTALNNVIEDMAREVSTIVVAHIRGDRDALSEAVAAFCEKRVVVKGDPKRQVH